MTTAIVVAALIFLVVLLGGLGYNYGPLTQERTRVEQEATDMEAKATAEQAYEQETTKIRSEVQPLKDKVTFVKQVQFHNVIRQRIYRQAAKYTYRAVELNSMAVSGNTLQVGAIASSLSDIGRFYIGMFGNPDVTAVSISGVPSNQQIKQQQPVTYPGGPPPLPPSFPVAMVATLVKSVSPPALPQSLASSAGGNGASANGGTAPGPPGSGMSTVAAPSAAPAP